MTTAQYNQCVKQHADGVFRFLLKLTSDEEIAKDLVQDCYERLWIKKESVDFEKSKSYLFTTAYHIFVDDQRKRKRVQPMGKADMIQPLVETAFPDVQEVLHKALETLPEIQKTVVLLRDYEQYSYDEIGSITGLTESQVKVYIYRARVSLKNYIGALENII